MSGPAAGTLPARPTTGRRIYRGLVFALLGGAAGAALGAAPALFVQSIFVGEAQRCVEAIERAEAGADIVLTCPDEFADPPVWIPPVLVVGGAFMGAAGGFGYGFALGSGRRDPRAERPWLPF